MENFDIDVLRKEIAEEDAKRKKMLSNITVSPESTRQTVDMIETILALNKRIKADVGLKAKADKANEIQKIRIIVDLYDSFNSDNQYLNKIQCNHDLNDNQLFHLFTLLQENEYISKCTSVDSCVWIFGGTSRLLSLCLNFHNLNRSYDEHGDNIDSLWTWNKDGLYYKFKRYIENFIKEQPIKWIKYNSRTKKYHLNKKALLDLLTQLNMPYEYLKDSKDLSKYFADIEDNPIVFNKQNYKEYEKKGGKSEYHDNIKTFIEQARKIK